MQAATQERRDSMLSANREAAVVPADLVPAHSTIDRPLPRFSVPGS
jgi:hypothetical protein